MPFVFDNTQIVWPEDDSDPPPPRADEFVYIAPPQIWWRAGARPIFGPADYGYRGGARARGTALRCRDPGATRIGCATGLLPIRWGER
jgi:hypothetical protein